MKLDTNSLRLDMIIEDYKETIEKFKAELFQGIFICDHTEVFNNNRYTVNSRFIPQNVDFRRRQGDISL